MQGYANDNDSALAAHRSKVFHVALLKILESAIRAASKDGFLFSRRGRMLLAKLVLAILSMDYEEAYAF